LANNQFSSDFFHYFVFGLTTLNFDHTVFGRTTYIIKTKVVLSQAILKDVSIISYLRKQPLNFGQTYLDERRQKWPYHITIFLKDFPIISNFGQPLFGQTTCVI
jgi:hypothetical protein